LQERQRLARELHDSVSQALYGIALGTKTARTLLERDPLKVAEPLDYVLSLSEGALTEMRALIFELRPESLEKEGLLAAIEKQVQVLQSRFGLNVKTELSGEPPLSLPEKEILYRITQEATHNIIKHSAAKNVKIQLQQKSDGYVLEIHDDGKGFDPQESFPGHLGLRSMQERVEQVGGSLLIDSQPGKGTCLQAIIPLN
jgi:signal transduction histidine kinase